MQVSSLGNNERSHAKMVANRINLAHCLLVESVSPLSLFVSIFGVDEDKDKDKGTRATCNAKL